MTKAKPSQLPSGYWGILTDYAWYTRHDWGIYSTEADAEQAIELLIANEWEDLICVRHLNIKPNIRLPFLLIQWGESDENNNFPLPPGFTDQDILEEAHGITRFMIAYDWEMNCDLENWLQLSEYVISYSVHMRDRI